MGSGSADAILELMLSVFCALGLLGQASALWFPADPLPHARRTSQNHCCARPLPHTRRTNQIHCCASDVWAELARRGCECATDDERRALIGAEVRRWPPEDVKANREAFSDELSALAKAIQTTAMAAHERGEDTSAAQQKLWAVVDMSVQSTLIAKELNGEDMSGFTVDPDGRIRD